MGELLQKSRDIKTKILFLRDILSDNNLMKEILCILEAQKNGLNRLKNTLDSYK